MIRISRSRAGSRFRTDRRVIRRAQVYNEEFDDQILGMYMMPTKQLLFWTRKKLITATTNLVMRYLHSSKND